MEVNKSLAEAVAISNNIDAERLSIIFSRILSNNSNDVSKLFSDKDKEKLIKVMNVKESEFVNLINALYFLAFQAAFDRDFKVAETPLRNCGLKDTHIKGMQDVWNENVADFTSKIKEKPIATQKKLNNVSWSINVPFKESKLPVEEPFQLDPENPKKDKQSENLYSVDARNPSAFVNFELGDAKDDGSSDNFVVKMNKYDLQQFFVQLEYIQKSIDSLM